MLKEFYVRIREEEVKEDFERINEELEKRAGNYGDVNTGIFALKLAAEFLDDYDALSEKIDNAIP